MSTGTIDPRVHIPLIQEVTEKACEAATIFGHDMRAPWYALNKDSRLNGHSSCRACGMWLQIDSFPRLDVPSVYGGALSLCRLMR